MDDGAKDGEPPKRLKKGTRAKVYVVLGPDSSGNDRIITAKLKRHAAQSYVNKNPGSRIERVVADKRTYEEDQVNLAEEKE